VSRTDYDRLTVTSRESRDSETKPKQNQRNQKYNTLRLPKSAELQNSLDNSKMSVEENETTNLQQEVPMRLTIEAVTVMVESSLSFSSSNNQLQPM
jgi:hypothetical protein